MNLLQFVPIKLTGCLVTGIFIGYHFDISLWISLTITAAGLCMLGLIHCKSSRPGASLFGYGTIICCMGLGLSSIALQSEMDYSSQLNPLEIHKERLWNLNIREVIKPSNYYYRYLAGVDQLDGNSSGGLILCRLPIEKNAKLAVGDNILVWAAASEIDPPRNPFQFDYKKYMEDQGVLLQMMLDETNYISLNGNDSRPLDRLQKFCYRIIQQLKQLDFGKNERAVIQALLLGHRHDIDKELSDHYKAAGAMHIMAISGLHVGVILVMEEGRSSNVSRQMMSLGLQLVVLERLESYQKSSSRVWIVSMSNRKLR